MQLWMNELREGWEREHQGVDASALVPLAYLARMAILLEDFESEVLEPHGLRPSDYSVLAMLRRSGAPYSLKPSQLYSELRRSSGGMTKILKRLEGLGLVERQPDPQDGRGSLITLTASGLELQERAFLALVVAAESRLAPLSRDGRAFVEQGLGSFAQAFEVTR